MGLDRQEEATVVVVEDHDMLRPVLQRCLLVAGYQRAWCVETIREALVWLRAGPVDVVVMDISLPQGDVYPDGCLAGIAIAKEWPRTKVLFMSGHGPAYIEEHCPPGIPLLEKPFVLQAFLARIAETLLLPPWIPPEKWPL